jgi:hypothetical protein
VLQLLSELGEDPTPNNAASPMRPPRYLVLAHMLSLLALLSFPTSSKSA